MQWDIFTNRPSVNKEGGASQLYLDLTTNYLIYTFWGPSALLLILISGASSIRPHSAAIHMISEHY